MNHEIKKLQDQIAFQRELIVYACGLLTRLIATPENRDRLVGMLEAERKTPTGERVERLIDQMLAAAKS